MFSFPSLAWEPNETNTCKYMHTSVLTPRHPALWRAALSWASNRLLSIPAVRLLDYYNMAPEAVSRDGKHFNNTNAARHVSITFVHFVIIFDNTFKI